MHGTGMGSCAPDATSEDTGPEPTVVTETMRCCSHKPMSCDYGAPTPRFCLLASTGEGQVSQPVLWGRAATQSPRFGHM